MSPWSLQLYFTPELVGVGSGRVWRSWTLMGRNQVDFVQISCPVDQGPMHYIDGQESQFCPCPRVNGVKAEGCHRPQLTAPH